MDRPPNGLWSTASNWSGNSKPTSSEPGGTIVQFGANTASSMDISGLVVDQIHFTGANNTITGTFPLTINGSTLTQNVVSDASGNTLGSALAVAITGGSPVELVSSAGTLTVAGQLSGCSGLVFLGTEGNFALTPLNGDTYTGPTTIFSGALHIATSNGLVIGGSSIVIGSGRGSGAQLVLDNSSDISSNTAITVNGDGVFDFNSNSDSAKSLTVTGGSVLGANLNMTGPLVMSDGTITIAAQLSAGSLTMTGGTISGPGHLGLSGGVQATSSPAGPATLASGVQLSASPTVTVNPGTAPELRVTGVISEMGGAQSIIKAGTGTMLTSAANTYTGATTVAAGTLLANGSQVGPVSVGPNGTLGGSGTVGATTVAGVLAPTAPGLNTGGLSFGPAGSLAVTLTSIAAGAVPSVMVTGTITIDPSAALHLVVAPGLAIPRGSDVLLIGNDASEAILGHFTGAPTNSVLSTVNGVPLAVNYAGGDGNDLTLGDVPPRITSTGATPNPVVAGQQVSLSISASDANQDPLTTTWNFGDGTTGAGVATSHLYTKSGTYTAVATVSDGFAQVQSSTVITVTAMRTSGGGSGTTTVKSSGYGADFRLSTPSACVAKGTPFTITLSIKKRTKGGALVKVTKVEFAINGKTIKTKRSAPFSARLSVSPTATSGSTIKARAKAYLKIHGGKGRTKSITGAIKVC